MPLLLTETSAGSVPAGRSALWCRSDPRTAWGRSSWPGHASRLWRPGIRVWAWGISSVHGRGRQLAEPSSSGVFAVCLQGDLPGLLRRSALIAHLCHLWFCNPQATGRQAGNLHRDLEDQGFPLSIHCEVCQRPYAKEMSQPASCTDTAAVSSWIGGCYRPAVSSATCTSSSNRRIRRSIRNGPNGTRALTNTSTTRPMGHLATIQTWSNAASTNVNSTPCAQPTTITAAGFPARYLSGMATPSRSRKDTPSIRVSHRRRRIGIRGFDTRGNR